jgi:NNP family nitrate/nitrite transporter-like MFS transporter
MMPLYLVSEKGFDRSWANTLLGLSRISGLFMTFFAGWLTERIGEKNAIRLVFFLAGVATILLGTAPSSYLVAIIFLQPALIVCYFPSGFSALSRIAPPNLRSVTNAMAIPLAFLIGGGFMPALIGYLGDTKAFSVGIIIAGGFILLGSILVTFLQLREQEEGSC